MKKYDLIVIGCGPGGEKAAVKAAYFKHKVAIIEQHADLGGAAVNTGTLPSKTLKDTAIFFSGKYAKGLYGTENHGVKLSSIEQFMYRTRSAMESEREEVRQNIIRHKVDLYPGLGRFVDSHTVEIVTEDGSCQSIQGDFILIATGSYPFHPPHIPFDSKRVHDSDSILSITRMPKSICVLGAGVIGCEYATIFSTLGIPVDLVNSSDKILPFLDHEISNSLVDIMTNEGIKLHVNDSVTAVNVPPSEEEPLTLHLQSGKTIKADMFLFAAGRSGQTSQLQCDKVGVKIGKREAVEVDKNYRTSVPHIYAIGDVIGFPALASTSMDQGRVAVTHMFNTKDFDALAKVIPYGIYTIPEISMAGITEEEAKEQNILYCTGKARYKDIPRGKIMGVKEGYLKLVFRRDDQSVIGVHIIGNIASELIHYGMTLVDNKKKLQEVISVVFNVPTLHELYKYAAYDGLGNLSGHKIKTLE